MQNSFKINRLGKGVSKNTKYRGQVYTLDSHFEFLAQSQPE
jgi:hypothetical protein